MVNALPNRLEGLGRNAVTVITEVEKRVSSALLATGNENKWEQGILGLLVNNEERVVRRKGMPGEEAKLTGRTW